MNWTTEQLEAIEKHGTNIIVSAGAGSGKTAVLTERTIRNLKEFSIDKMIILTFTKAAAFSMKEKIKKALKKSDEALKENLKIIDGASICTFDSFSLDLVKKYSDLLNLDSNIEIADGVLIASLKRKIIDDVFDEFYQDQNFLEFLDEFTVKDDKSVKTDIEEILANLDKIYDPIKYLDNYFKEFDAIKNQEFVNEYIKLIDNKYIELKAIYEELTRLVSNQKEEDFINSLSSYMNFSSFEEYILFQDYKITYRLKGNEEFKNKYNEFKEKVEEIKELAIYKSTEEICIIQDLEDECAKIDILSSEIDEYNKEILTIL